MVKADIATTQEVLMSKSQMKTMLVTFFDIKGTVHFEFNPQGQTVNRAYYVEILKWLRDTVRRNFDPVTEFYTMTMLQLCQAVSGPKINY